MHTQPLLFLGTWFSLCDHSKVSFPGAFPAWQRIRCSSTESKQPPFRGSKYFATCYFSLIYYEHIFPFIRGFANSLESQNLSFLPAIPGDPEGFTQPWLPSQEGDVLLQEPGIVPCSFPGTAEVEICCEQWCWVVDQSEEKFPLVCPRMSWRGFRPIHDRNG